MAIGYWTHEVSLFFRIGQMPGRSWRQAGADLRTLCGSAGSGCIQNVKTRAGTGKNLHVLSKIDRFALINLMLWH